MSFRDRTTPLCLENLRDLPISARARSADGNWLYSFGGDLPRCGAARFPEFSNRAVLLPESFRGRLLLRRRPTVTLAAGRSLPRSVETARSIAPPRLAVKRRNIPRNATEIGVRRIAEPTSKSAHIRVCNRRQVLLLEGILQRLSLVASAGQCAISGRQRTSRWAQRSWRRVFSLATILAFSASPISWIM